MMFWFMEEFNAGYKGVDLYIDAKNIDPTNLGDYAANGPLNDILKQGTISSIYVRTELGWIGL